jgi:hypothetical protein
MHRTTLLERIRLPGRILLRASDEAFRDFIGKYKGNRHLICWWREDALEYGYDCSVVERCADREMLARLAAETIPI